MKNQYEEIKREVSPELCSAVMKVLLRCQGRGKATGRADLVRAVRALGQPAHERAVREAIKSLRRQGYLICSAPGEDGGYYMASNQAEFDEFARSEFEAKITDMSETLGAMRKSARAQFGGSAQMQLI